MNIYMLNTKIGILTGYTGDDGVAGSAKLHLAQFKDPRYICNARSQCLHFYFQVNQQQILYAIKDIIIEVGLYESNQDISDDMIRFLDRFLEIMININAFNG